MAFSIRVYSSNATFGVVRFGSDYTDYQSSINSDQTWTMAAVAKTGGRYDGFTVESGDSAAVSAATSSSGGPAVEITGSRMTQDTVVRLNFSAQTHAVTLNANGGGGGTASVTATYGSDMPTPIVLPSRTGHRFLGYFDDAETQYYTSGGDSARTWDKTDAATLYAHWAASTYYVALNQQDGSGGTEAVAATYGENMPSISKPSRNGYTFGGYFTGTNGTGDQYYLASGSSAQRWYRTAGYTTLYAYWRPNTYTVTLDRQSGSGGSSSVTVTYGGAMPSITVPSRTGYTFGGYFTGTNGTGDQYYTASGGGAQAWYRGNATLYAKWTVHSYGVTYVLNNGTHGTTHPTSATYDAAFYVSAPTRTGCTFKGWTVTSGLNTSTAKWGTGSNPTTTIGSSSTKCVNGAAGNVYFKNLTPASGGSVTLTANWQANTYAVTLDQQDGSGGTASVTATYGSAMPSITLPKRTGYTFGGYYTSTGGGGTQYYTAAGASALNWNKTAATTLYAKWTADTYELYVNPAGGTYAGSSGSKRVSPNSNGVYLTTGISNFSGIGQAVRQGYDLAGYNDASTGGVRVYDVDGRAVNGTYWDGSGSTAKFKGLSSGTSLTVYARWAPREYVLKVDPTGGTFRGSSDVSVFDDPKLRTNTGNYNQIGSASRAGFVFVGFFNAATGGEMVYDANGHAVRGAYWTDDFAHGALFKGMANASATALTVWAHWLASVTVEMSAICGDTDAQGAIPEVAGSPTVKIGDKAGEVSVSAVATQGDGLVVYASAEVRGMKISRITASDAGGVLVDMTVDPADAVGGFCKASLVPRAADITVRAVYSRNPVSVSVAKGTASASLSPSPYVDPPAVQYRFGDVVNFVTAESATGIYPFFCWSDSPDTPTAEPDEAATAATYRVTLTGDTALYAHYARVVGVSKRAVDSTGAATEDEGGSVLVYALGVEHAVADTGLTGLAVPFGGSLRIVSTADTSDGYRFLGVKFRSGQSERDTGYASDETFQPEGNGTYEVTFQKNPPDVYLACADVAETGETGTVGQTVAVYNGTEEGAFEPVDEEDVPPFENAPAGARWYKVRAGTVVTLVASRSSEADALSRKGVEYVDLVEEGEAIPTPPEYDTGDGNSQEEVWRNRSYAVSGNRAVVTTWGNYPSPKVTLAARTGGSAAFKGEDPDLHEKTYEADYDSETGIYTYQTATVVAEAFDGYVFVGWYSANLAQVVSDAAEYSFEVRQDESLEAVFRKDDNAVFEWEGGTSKKMVEWRSGVMTVPKPADPVAARVDATGYPVGFDVGTYSSPDAEPTRQHAVEITSQDGRRLPRLRPERFWRMSVRARVEIDAIAVATNVAEVN